MNDAESQSNDQARRRASLRRALVRDATTPPERLRELAAEADALPRERQRFAAALAMNPNVPTDLVSRYLYLAPSAFCRNPALTSWGLNVDFLHRIPESHYYPRLGLPLNLRRPLPAQQAMLLGLGRLLRSPRAPNSLIAEIAAQKTYPYLAFTAQSHVRLAVQITPDAVENSLAEYWIDALADEMNKTRGKLLRQLLDRDLATAALRFLLPPSLKAAKDAPEEADKPAPWTRLLIREQQWSALKDNIAAGLPTESSGRIEEVTRENLIRKPLDVEETDLLEGASATVLLYRTLALLRASEALRRATIRRFAESSLWHDRVAAALALRPFPGEDRLRPRYQTLLERLARDGNRYVRAVAGRRIVEPGWQFPYFQA